MSNDQRSSHNASNDRNPIETPAVSSTTLEVRHEPDMDQFVIVAHPGARLLYKINRAHTYIDLEHTEVPVDMRRRGVAALLTEEAFRFAKRKNFAVIPSCTYISGTFLDRNPHWRAIVAPDGRSFSNKSTLWFTVGALYVKFRDYEYSEYNINVNSEK
eukprot:726239_1